MRVLHVDMEQAFGVFGNFTACNRTITTADHAHCHAIKH